MALSPFDIEARLIDHVKWMVLVAWSRDGRLVGRGMCGRDHGMMVVVGIVLGM